MEVCGLSFKKICEIVPELDADGGPREFMPQSRYAKREEINLHEYGLGPFCKLKIPTNNYGLSGVYVFLLNDSPTYVGECVDLVDRFNNGYGNILPKNCYIGGQQTNCRVNNLILKEIKQGLKVELFFYETNDRKCIQDMLIDKLQPKWNKEKEIITS